MPFIRLSKRGPLGQLLDNHLDTSGIDLLTVAYAETYQMAKSLVAHGAGVTVVDEITGRSAGQGNVVPRRLKPAVKFQLSILHLDIVPQSIITRRFIGYLHSYVKQFLSTPLPTVT